MPQEGKLAKPATSVLAWAVIGGCMTSIVAINVFAVHYREVGLRADELSQQRVVEHALGTPWDVSLESGSLFVLGILAAVLAGWKGLTSTDRVPGYEAVSRRADAATAAQSDLKGTLRGMIEQATLAELEAVSAKGRAWRAVLAEARRREASLNRLSAKVARVDALEEAAGTAAISAFRELNTRVRQDGVKVAYFAEPIDWAAETARMGADQEMTGSDVAVADKEDAMKSATARIAEAIREERERVAGVKAHLEVAMRIIVDSAADAEVAKIAALDRLLTTGRADE